MNESEEAFDRGINKVIYKEQLRAIRENYPSKKPEVITEINPAVARRQEQYQKQQQKIAEKEAFEKRKSDYRTRKLQENQKKVWKERYSRKRPSSLKKGWGAGVTKGVKGLLGAFTVSDEQLQGAGGSSSPGSSGRGRGRPVGSYRYVIPGVGPVPIQAFKRYLTQQKALQRLNRELAVARAGQMPPPDHVRGNFAAPDETDRFLAEDSVMDQMAQQQFAQQQMTPDQSMQMPRRKFDVSGFLNKAANVMTGGMSGQQQNRISLMGSQQRFAQPQYPGQPNPALIDIWGNRGPKILAQRNIFNVPRADGRLPLV